MQAPPSPHGVFRPGRVVRGRCPRRRIDSAVTVSKRPNRRPVLPPPQQFGGHPAAAVLFGSALASVTESRNAGEPLRFGLESARPFPYPAS